MPVGEVIAAKSVQSGLQPGVTGNSAGRHSETVPLPEMIRQSREQVQQHTRKFCFKSSTRYGDIPLEAYARLARARSRGQVGAAAGYARRQIYRLRSAVRSDPERAGEIRTAMRQLERAVLHAARKRRDLEREESMEHIRRRAEQEDRRREALRLQSELQRKKTARCIRERGYPYQAAAEQYLRARLEGERQDLTAALPLEAGAPQRTGEGAPTPSAPAISIRA